MPEQALAKKNDNKPVSDIEGKGPKKNSAVTKERIERVKKAFRPSWLLDQINTLDRNASKKHK